MSTCLADTPELFFFFFLKKDTNKSDNCVSFHSILVHTDFTVSAVAAIMSASEMEMGLQ